MEKPKELKKLSASLTKVFDCVDHNKLWKILTEMGILDHLTCLLRNLYAGQEATVRTGMEQQTDSNWERSMSRLYCHPATLTSHKIPGWKKHKLESRLPGKIMITSDTQMTSH